MKKTSQLLVIIMILVLMLPLGVSAVDNTIRVEPLKAEYSKAVLGVENKQINFEAKKFSTLDSFKDGVYEIVTLEPGTTIKYTLNFRDTEGYNIESTGYLIEEKGEIIDMKGGIMDAHTYEDFRDPQTGLYYPKIVLPNNFRLLNSYHGKEYNILNDSVYGYILYNYVPKGTERTLDNYYDFMHLKLFNISESKDLLKETVEENIKALPNSSKVMVNGNETAFEAYTINGNNYFKLRDMAKVVSGTEKQFEVGWDNVNKTINLLSNKKYTEVGGELAKGDGREKEGILNKSQILKDGKEVDLTAYTINGNNFFKLRDLASAFDIGVTWNNDSKTVGIDTSIPYLAE